MRAKALLLTMVLGGSLGTGAALQRGGTGSAPTDQGYGPTANPDYDRLNYSVFHARQESTRLKSLNAERQRTLTREATELLYKAGELQLKAQKSDASQEEMLHEVETIEKLAHNVKERMKGMR